MSGYASFQHVWPHSLNNLMHRPVLLELELEGGVDTRRFPIQLTQKCQVHVPMTKSSCQTVRQAQFQLTSSLPLPFFCREDGVQLIYLYFSLAWINSLSLVPSRIPQSNSWERKESMECRNIVLRKKIFRRGVNLVEEEGLIWLSVGVNVWKREEVLCRVSLFRLGSMDPTFHAEGEYRCG